MQHQAGTSTQRRVDRNDAELAQHVSAQPHIPPLVREKISSALATLREAECALTGVQRARGNGYILSLEVRQTP